VDVASTLEQEATMQTSQTAISELMSLPVVTVGPNARAQEVLALANAKGVHHFPIVEHDKLLGIVCTCDLQELSPSASVLQVAWRHVVTLDPQGSITEAAHLMALHGVGSIVVANERGVCGIVTREDLVRREPQLDQLFADAHCAACGARKHLRPGPDGQCICQSCQARAKEGASLELGDGD
jgi:acetoin utilization protein AcuB